MSRTLLDTMSGYAVSLNIKFYCKGQSASKINQGLSFTYPVRHFVSVYTLLINDMRLLKYPFLKMPTKLTFDVLFNKNNAA